MKKRIAAFLSLCLIVVCLFPTCAFAANMENPKASLILMMAVM